MNDLLVPLTDAELLSKLTATEHGFVERKTSGDSKDWLKTVVAFANSTPVGYPAVLFIGVKNDGTPEGGTNLDTLQQSFNRKIELAYPPIYFTTKILEKNGAQFLAVIVPGSASRPHFAGPSYIRKGSCTEVASEQQFDQLLSTRTSKSAEILKWRGKLVSIDWIRVENVDLMGPVERTQEQIVSECNAFYVTLANAIGYPGQSVPLRRVEISFDNVKTRLKLEIYPV
ncbi:MAG TPA: ATP-binding protein [Candidatus Dormibacteraeota bacterium]|jgi:predicted HTH transcriptional regulator|nr:ATP-binding protein [Candidatus Dormibacteraeota bacterium]